MMQPGEAEPCGKIALRRCQALGDRDVDQRLLRAARRLSERRRVPMKIRQLISVPGAAPMAHAGAPPSRSNFAAMMKSFSCSPLIFLVCSETVA